MKTVRWFCAIALVGFTSPFIQAQDFPKPGPEHEVLKHMQGTWDVTMKMAGAESKGSATYKMELGGLWLVSSFECELFGSKFTGKGLDTYDPGKKKYISVWFDSMSTTPMTMEGTYDKEKRSFTLVGDTIGMDGKPTKAKSVSVMKDDNTVEFSMWMGDGKDPAFTITYKRKK